MKNLHLEHLEELVFNDGGPGVKSAIQFLKSLRDMLASTSQSSTLNLSTKFDGSPSIFAGINPENGKFFIGTKSVFAKNSKLNYTDADIDKNHTSEGLNSTLKIALRYLRTLDIKGIIQGDIMFVEDSIQEETIDGQEYITFQPNTITYAIPSDSALADQIRKAKIGIIWHTSYTGPKMDDMKASFNVNLGSLRVNKDVWMRDASFIDVSGTATFTADELKNLDNLLEKIERLFKETSVRVLSQISLNETYKTFIKQWNNIKIKNGDTVSDSSNYIKGLILFIELKLNDSIKEAKKIETKQKRQKEKTIILNFFKNNKDELIRIVDLYNLLVEAKHIIIRKLEKVKSIGTFLRTDDGFKVTNPEGFVASDKLSGNTIKLVDRLVFSRANFNTAKNWDK